MSQKHSGAGGSVDVQMSSRDKFTLSSIGVLCHYGAGDGIYFTSDQRGIVTTSLGSNQMERNNVGQLQFKPLYQNTCTLQSCLAEVFKISLLLLQKKKLINTQLVNSMAGE